MQHASLESTSVAPLISANGGPMGQSHPVSYLGGGSVLRTKYKVNFVNDDALHITRCVKPVARKLIGRPIDAFIPFSLANGC